MKHTLLIIIITVLTFCTQKKDPVDKKTGQRNSVLLLSYLGSYAFNPDLLTKDTAYAISDITRKLYNSNIAGKQGGAVVALVSCSGGGTVYISGTASSSSGTTTLNLQFEYSGCISTDTYYRNMSLTGTSTYTGSFNSASSNLVTASSSMKMAGDLTFSSRFLTPVYSISQTCAYSIQTASGNLCGRNYSY